MGGQFEGRGSMNKTGIGGSHDRIMFGGKLKQTGLEGKGQFTGFWGGGGDGTDLSGEG